MSKWKILVLDIVKWDSLKDITNHIHIICHLVGGASTVKWTTLDPCSGLCESDPKLYTNFEFHEIEIHKNLVNILIYKAKQFMFTKKQFQTTYIYCRRQCKWWTSGWHRKDNCQKLVQSIISLHEFDDLEKNLLWPQVYNKFKECEKKNARSKYLRSWNLRSKLHVVSCFYASLLIIGSKDLILIFYIWVPKLTIEVIMKNNQF